MSFRAPLRVPVELKRQNRWFLLAHSVSVDGLTLSAAVPEEVEGPLEISFHLPGSDAQLTCHGEVIEEVVGEGDEERVERRAVRFLDLDQAAAVTIQAYVQDRLGII